MKKIKDLMKSFISKVTTIEAKPNMKVKVSDICTDNTSFYRECENKIHAPGVIRGQVESCDGGCKLCPSNGKKYSVLLNNKAYMHSCHLILRDMYGRRVV